MERMEQNNTERSKLRHDMFAELLDISDMLLQTNMKLTTLNNNMSSQYREELPASDFRDLIETDTVKHIDRYLHTLREQINKYYENIGV